MGNTLGFTYTQQRTEAKRTKHDFAVHLSKKGFCTEHADIQLRVKECFRWKTILPSCPKCNEKRMLERIQKEREEELERVRASLEHESRSKRFSVELKLKKKREKREILREDIIVARDLGLDPSVAILTDDEGFPYLDYALCFAISTDSREDEGSGNNCIIS
jgi:hypothetical protein